MDRAIYPKQILYNGGLTKLEFFYSDRTDYVVYYQGGQCHPAPHQRKKLDRVDISTTTSGQMQLVRRYAFNYDYSTFPGVYFDQGAGRLTLKKITQYDTDGATYLPPYEFTYTNNRLTEVKNNIGGKTTFAYDTVVAGVTNNTWSEDLTSCGDGNPNCNPNWTGNNAFVQGGVFDGIGITWVHAMGSPAYVYRNMGKFIPGTTYKFSADVGGGGFDTSSVRLAVYDGIAETFVTDWYYPSNPYQTVRIGGMFTTSDRGGSLELRIYTQNHAPMRSVILEIHNTRHRVTTKTVDDGNGTIGTYQYAYQGPAVNEVVSTYNPLHDKGWQFRGHAVVTVTDPSGAKTTNHFRQDDFFVGRAVTITQMTVSNQILARTLNSYGSMCIPVVEWVSATQSKNSCTGVFFPTPTPVPTLTPTPVPPPPPPPPDPPEPWEPPDPGGWGLLPQPQSPRGIAFAPKEIAGAKLANWIVDTGSENTVGISRISFQFPAASSPIHPAVSGAPAGGMKAYFVYLASTTRETYDGQATPKTQKTEFTYDGYGNLQSAIERDQNNAIYRKTVQTFYPNTSAWIVNKPGLAQVFDSGNTRVAETRTFYDGATSHTTPPTKGDLTRVDVTANGAAFFTRATNTYDQYGNVLTTKDARNNTTTMQYDNVYSIFPTTVTNAAGHMTTNTYNYRLGKLATTTDPNNATTSYTYDVFGRTTSIKLPLEQSSANATVLYEYNLGNPRSFVRVQVRNDLGGTNPATYQNAWWFYDGLGRVIQRQTQAQTSGQIILTNTGYDQRGKVSRVSNPYAVTASGGAYQAPNWSQPLTEQQYDAIGRMIKTINPDTTFQTLGYNQWTTTITDANGHPRQSIADAFGRTIQIKEFNAGATHTTDYAYDVLNRLTQVQDAASPRNLTTMNYDWLGRKTSMTDPDLGVWSYAYDNASNLTRQTDAKNQTTCFYYDPINRLKGKNYRSDVNCPLTDPGTYTVGYTYDAYDPSPTGNKGKGRRTGMSDNLSGATVSTGWVYDIQGRVSSQTDTIPGASALTTSWTYDALNRARMMTYPDGEIVTTAYNAQMLPQTLSGYVTGATYNAAGQLTTLNLNNTATTTYTYHAQNLRLTQLTTSGNLQNLSYLYDNVGNIARITDTVRSEISNFTYDDLDRLTGVTGAYSQNWVYNAIGNITSRTGVNAATFSYGDAAHKHAVTTVGGTTYGYDPNGNMTSRGSDAFTYNYENRLTQATVGGVVTQYVYNGDGARVKKVVGSTATYYIGNWYEVTNGAITKYYYFGSQRVAMKQGSAVTYLHSDHLGSTSVASNASGALVSRQTYYPYGAPRTSEGALPTDYTFTGQRADASAGLMFYNARYYDAALGRFISVDTIVPSAANPQALNRYSYVLNNPLKYTDPTGHCPTCLIGGSLGAIAGAVSYTASVVASGQGAAGWDYGNYLASVGVGGASGALIGAGFSPTMAGTLAEILISAGSNAATTALGYTATHTSNFNSTDLIVESTISGATGAAAPLLGSSAVTSGVVNGAGSTLVYGYEQVSQGQSPTAGGMIISGSTGFVGGAVGGLARGQTLLGNNGVNVSGQSTITNVRYGTITATTYKTPIAPPTARGLFLEGGVILGSGSFGSWLDEQIPY